MKNKEEKTRLAKLLFEAEEIPILMMDFSEVDNEILFIRKTNLHAVLEVREALYKYALEGNIKAIIAFAKL